MSHRSEMRRYQGASGSLYENLGALGKVPVSSCLGVEKKMQLNTKIARPGAKRLCQLLTTRQKSLWDHRLQFWEHELFFLKLFVFSIIRSFLFLVFSTSLKC